MGSVNRDTTRRIESVEERSPDPRVNLTQSHFSVGWLRTKSAIGLGLEPNFSWRIIMTVELYYLPGSPYAWRVQLCLEHKGVPYSPKKVDFGGGEAKSDAFLEMNPRSKVPVIRDGSFTLYESAAILEYLEERYPEAKKIYPENLETRAQVRRLICARGWTASVNAFFMISKGKAFDSSSESNRTSVLDGSGCFITLLPTFGMASF